jgi:hypothetical protein
MRKTKVPPTAKVTAIPLVISGWPLKTALSICYLTSFTLYLMTLAPTVTFEDSGELIAAAYLLGVPHEPGYPLFTMLGHLFSYLPFGNIAFRINLMSAFFSSLGAVFVAWTALLLIEQIVSAPTRSSKPSYHVPISIWLVYACGLCAGLLVATSYENWEQSIITEVYGLNAFFVGIVLYLTARWSQSKQIENRAKLFYIICFFTGLALTNHPTFVLIIPVLIIYAIHVDKGFILQWRRLIKGTSSLALGLLPYAYLPIASSRDPQMDWGNPETLTNFFRVIMRHQYQLGDSQAFGKFISQLTAYGRMIMEQWWAGVLVLALVGMWALYRRRRSYFYMALLFLFFTGPLTTYLTNFDIATANPVLNAEHKALVSVFYIPSYLMIAILIGLGFYYLLEKNKLTMRYNRLLSIIVVLIPLALSYTNYKTLDMSRYTFTEDYVENLFKIAPENSVVFVNWDPFIFPCNYYQYVEQKRTDVTVVDQELLRRSWYIQSLRIHHASFMSRAEKEIDEFLEAVQPFENKEKFDGNFIQSKYIAMINALIDRTYEMGHDVFLTYDPPAGVAEKYFKESVIAAVKLRKEMKELTTINVESLQFRNFFDASVPPDRMARFFRTYYGRLIFARGFAAEKLEQPAEASLLYEKAYEFLNDNPSFLLQVNEARQRLSKVPSGKNK